MKKGTQPLKCAAAAAVISVAIAVGACSGGDGDTGLSDASDDTAVLTATDAAEGDATGDSTDNGADSTRSEQHDDANANINAMSDAPDARAPVDATVAAAVDASSIEDAKADILSMPENGERDAVADVVPGGGDEARDAVADVVPGGGDGRSDALADSGADDGSDDAIVDGAPGSGDEGSLGPTEQVLANRSPSCLTCGSQCVSDDFDGLTCDDFRGADVDSCLRDRPLCALRRELRSDEDGSLVPLRRGGCGGVRRGRGGADRAMPRHVFCRVRVARRVVYRGSLWRLDVPLRNGERAHSMFAGARVPMFKLLLTRPAPTTWAATKPSQTQDSPCRCAAHACSVGAR